MTKVLVLEKDYPDAATYRGPAFRLDLHVGQMGLSPNAEQLEAAAKTAMADKGIIPLRIKIYFEETIPVRHIYYELYGYSPTARAIDPITLAALIIVGIFAILSLYILWQISITGKEIIWGPSDGAGIPWGAIVILAIVGVAAYFLVTQKEVVTKGIRVVGKPIAKRVRAL